MNRPLTKKDKLARLRQTLFTGRADELALFRSLLPLDRQADADILVIYGIGGIGKSVLLGEYRRICSEADVPVALIDGQAQRSIFSILLEVKAQLKDSLSFAQFEEGLKRYQGIQDKLVGRADIPQKVIATLSKGVFHTAKAVPVAGVVAEAVGEENIRLVMDAIYSVVGRKDGEFFLQPEDELTRRLVADINEYAAERRLVVMFDTYEVMDALDGWARDGFFANLGGYALLVIAGRHKLEGKEWGEYFPLMIQHELGSLSDEEGREYLGKRGVADDALAYEMTAFADGHPLTLSLLAESAAHMKTGDLARTPERRDVVRVLIARITGQVAEDMRAALETCGVLRYVTEESLSHMLEDSTGRIDAMHSQQVEENARQTLKLIDEYEDRLRLSNDPKEQAYCREQLAELRRQLADLQQEQIGPTWNVSRLFEEVRKFDFAKVRNGGLALHEAVRVALDEDLRWRAPERYRALHERAAEYYEKRLTIASGEDRERWTLERLYHRVHADEEIGIRLFQEIAEELTVYRLVNRLRDLLNDVNDYPLERENSRLWREYYNARLAHMELRLADAEKAYQTIGENEQAEPKLRAYALCDWGESLSYYGKLGQLGGLEKATSILERSLHLVPLDFHLARGFFHLARVQRYQARWDEESSFLEEAKRFFEQREDKHGLAHVHVEMKRGFAQRGSWKELFTIQERLEDLYHRLPESAALKSRVLGTWGWCWALAGRLYESEQKERESIDLVRPLNDPLSLFSLSRDLGWSLGCQGRYVEAEQSFTESLEIARELGKGYLREVGYGLGFWGAILTRKGETDEATMCLLQSLAIKEQVQDAPGMLEPLAWLGRLYEVQQNLDKAQHYYCRCLELKWCGRHYFNSESLTGLVRVRHAQGDYAVIPPLLAEAEQLAQQYEYNDHLASLRLTQGHVAWEGHILEWGSDFDAALLYYRQALIYALRYNRFLLDEVLWGGNVATPLRPLIPHCRERGEEGRQMLTALRDWWQTGANDIGTPRPDTISPIPEGIPLLEAERVARQREPGDGSPQRMVVERINEALVSARGG